MNNAELTELKINLKARDSLSYPIYIGTNILKNAGNLVKNHISSSKILLVSNDTVFPIYGKTVIEALKKEGFDIKTTVIPDGEDYKNFGWFKVILDKAIDFNLERSDAIAALGGGVIGDMAGYAASSYLRGINLVQIATTLLAQVDSSIGGKTGINHPRGKNLIGAFYQPKSVIIDVSTLNTLDKRNLKNGLAEVLKYAFIQESCNYKEKSLNFFDFLYDNKDLIYKLDSKVIREMISYCCELKAAVVEQDEKEAGLRAILNLGHTTGHALEVCGDYNLLSHGEAVSIGMIAAIRLSKNKSLIDYNLAEKAENLIKHFDLPVYIPEEISIDRIIAAMKLDKKVQKKKVRFILPVKSMGKVEIYNDISDEEIIKVLEGMYN
jgi:3-dehydroquinate synthase